MHILQTPDQKAFAEEAVRSGRLQSERDEVAEALAMFERRERFRAGTLAARDAADRSVAAGPTLRIAAESFQSLAAG